MNNNITVKNIAFSPKMADSLRSFTFKNFQNQKLKN